MLDNVGCARVRASHDGSVSILHRALCLRNVHVNFRAIGTVILGKLEGRYAWIKIDEERPIYQAN